MCARFFLIKKRGLSRLLGHVSTGSFTELFAIKGKWRQFLATISRAIVFLLYNTNIYIYIRYSSFPFVLFINRAYEWNVNFREFPPVSTVFFSWKARGRVWINNLVSSWIFLPRNLSRRTELFNVSYEHFFPVLVNFPDTCFLEISFHYLIPDPGLSSLLTRRDPYLKIIVERNNVSFAS